MKIDGIILAQSKKYRLIELTGRRIPIYYIQKKHRFFWWRWVDFILPGYTFSSSWFADKEIALKMYNLYVEQSPD